MAATDETHDPALKSWVTSANTDGSDFPIQNLPFGSFRRSGTDEPYRIGVAIGDQVLDLRLASERAGWPDEVAALLKPLAAGDLNAFMTSGPQARSIVRRALSAALAQGSAQQAALIECLVPQADVELALPCRIGDYTDFYISVHHATTIGKQFRPDNPLLPNYKWVPIGYHGRASSIQPSGKSFHRPVGQTKAPDADAPAFGPSKRLDYELEMGIVMARPNEQGEPVSIEQAEDHVFGLTLFNDWSARDIQGWEYQPLGPFLSKNFASTLSPWIVTMEALAPFRRAFNRPEGDPQPLPYLDSPENREAGAIDVKLEVWLQTEAMRQAGHPGDLLSTSNLAEAYWSIAQLVAHHTVNGCNLNAGDLLGTGTLSGPKPEQAASLMELTSNGKQPIKLSSGEERGFLNDGDSIILKGFCERAGRQRIGFGECRGTVLPARGTRTN
ncbi:MULTISPECIES: fumarylacetoacetase [unclassified Caballeronia]|uniref:fumarylacetoacetase n=1 Tax=unclassified Caballeronia TaxID=2646786 RepID=UPI001F18FDF3|nr:MULTISPECIES: fumarylacetoacetase [unclassified Caballeronia]MCE4546031.1 fumarylacetoacetase [Caballeronia sp. PC1]MCE4573496.1 fumarylacetoacetase [Caballeronia sp. CLC5]